MQSAERRLARAAVRALAGLVAVAALPAQAQAIYDQVHTVALPTASVPLETGASAPNQDFSATAGVTYTVTLTDLGAQLAAQAAQSSSPSFFQALQTLKMAITTNDALVSLTPAGSSASATQLVLEDANPASTEVINGAAGATSVTATFTAATTGTYRIHVVGAPASGQPPGPMGVQVTDPTGTVVGSLGGSIGPAPQAQPAGVAYVQDTFTVNTTGSYNITFNDLAVPQALQGLTMIVLPTGGSSATATFNSAGTQSITLTAGMKYTIIAYGQATTDASGTPGGGLFSASITPVSGTAGSCTATSTSGPCGWPVPVGTTVRLGGAQPLPLSAGSYTFSLTDLKFPVALSLVGAAAVPANPANQSATLSGGGVPATLTVTTADSYQVFGAATTAAAGTGVGATPAAGSYAVQIAPAGGQPLFSVAEAVTPPGAALTAYTYDTTLTAADTYAVALTDFTTPTALAAADLAVVQNGAVVGTPLTQPGSFNAGLAAGPVTLLAFAAPGATAGSLMDVSLTSSAKALTFDQPQGVGVTFSTTTINIPSSNKYQFTLTDLAWPAAFAQGGTLAGYVTQGGTMIGQFIGGGSLPISVNAGTYYINVISAPAPASAGTGSDGAGTYALDVSQPPTVDLTAATTTVTSGGTVQLSWTTTGATSCTAGGGGWTGTFTGNQAASGSATSPAITANTTFTLACTGPGGSTSGSVSVTVSSSTAATSSDTPSSKGGGGAFDLATLLVLGGGLLVRRRRAVG